MAILTMRPKGTQDIIPEEIHKWLYVENILREISENFGFKEIRTPVFEHTELFLRSVGETTDVVQKEMYTFNDKGNRSITLKPEGTASALRGAIENSLTSDALPLKISYIERCFRYEKPQAGRFRQFSQFGVELLGADSVAADAEVIDLINTAFEHLGLKNVSLQINSIGCKECRPQYLKGLVAYFENHKADLCPTCLERLYKNPMRILDCKSEICSSIAKDAPKNIDYLCDECKNDFDKLKQLLTIIDINYTVNPKIVRGLDYYTKTVFEFVTNELGSQGTVCGGGRYNGLVKTLGGPDIGGIGFAMGLERLIALMDAQKCEFKPAKVCDLYIAPIGENALMQSVKITSQLRKEGFFAQTDLVGRSVKAQMKYANKIGAKFTVVLGDDELEKGIVTIKNMTTGDQNQVKLGSELIAAIYDAGISDIMEEISGNFEQFL